MIQIIFGAMMALAAPQVDHYETLKQVAFSNQEQLTRRWHALIALADSNPAKAKKDLAKALKGKEWYVRNAALLALNKVDKPQAQRAAIDLLSDRALVVRSAAVDVLDSSKPEVRKALWSELNKPHNFRKAQSLWIRSQILSKLAKTPLKSEMPNFLSHRNDEDKALKEVATAALGRLKIQ